MSPPKSMTDGKEKGKSVATTSARVTRSMVRKTRSETRRDGSNSAGSSSKLVKLESPKKRKSKTTAKGGATKKIKKEEETASEGEKEEEPTDEDVAAEEEDAKKKNIVIEHCKQCNSFKMRAKEVKEGLEKAVPGIIVTVNADKPRRGCFEIRGEGDETFISLLDMKRPFTAMKELDMEQVIADIIEKIT